MGQCAHFSMRDMSKNPVFPPGGEKFWSNLLKIVSKFQVLGQRIRRREGTVFLVYLIHVASINLYKEL